MAENKNPVADAAEQIAKDAIPAQEKPKATKVTVTEVDGRELIEVADKPSLKDRLRKAYEDKRVRFALAVLLGATAATGASVIGNKRRNTTPTTESPAPVESDEAYAADSD